MKTSVSMWSDKPVRHIKPEWMGAALWSLLAVLPLAAGILYGLLYSFGAVGLLSDGLTLEYWRQTLTDETLLVSFGYSFYVAILSMMFAVAGALLMMGVFRDYRDKRWTGLLLYLPLAIPSVVTAFFVYEMLGQSGWISRLVHRMGLMGESGQFPVMIQDPYAVGIIAAHVMMACPFFLILFMNIYQQEQIGRLRQVATSLGAGRWESDVKITYPILIRRSYPTLVLYFIFAMGSFEIPLLLGPSSPQVVAVEVMRKLRQFSLDTIPQAYVISLIYVVFVLVLVWMLLRNKKLFYDIKN